jgi:rSAM/selenodomain-associated transferase 1
MPQAAIGIVCKAPEPGQSKTRLIPRLGAEKSAALARAFLIDIADSIHELRSEFDVAGYAVCTPAEAAEELATFLPDNFGYAVHTDVVLGRVLARATDDLLCRGHDCVVLVNGDSPTLPPSLLKDCLLSLRMGDERAVFGPAIDGGYYLVGLNHDEPRLFEGIPWSTPMVLEATLAKARQIKKHVTQLGVWYDVDDAESLDLLLAEFNGRRPSGVDQNVAAGRAAATRRLFRESVFSLLASSV